MVDQNFITAHLKRKSALSILLYPLSLFFHFFACFRRFLYEIFPTLPYRSKIKIISVGNITSGGSGKTPFTLFLANKMIKKGYKIAIVLRGYKSALKSGTTLLNDSIVIGDEASIYATSLTNVPICVGKNRVKSIILLETKFPDLDFIIMDDAFQHIKVFQDKKICVFNTLNPIGNGFCLPAGILREPFKNLKYADYFVLNGDKNDLPKGFFKKLESFDKPILEGGSILSEIKDFSGTKYDIQTLQNKRILLLSGIGLPKSFENTVTKAGLFFEKHLALTDHFEYTQSFFDQNKSIFSQYDYVLTTEKDYGKIKLLIHETNILVVFIRFELFCLPENHQLF